MTFITKVKLIFVFSILSVLTLFIGGCGDSDKGKTAQDNSSGALAVVSGAADAVLSSVNQSSTEHKCTDLIDAYLSAILHRDFTKMEEIDKKGLTLKDASGRQMNGPITYGSYREHYEKPAAIRISGSQQIVDRLNEKNLQPKRTLLGKFPLKV